MDLRRRTTTARRARYPYQWQLAFLRYMGYHADGSGPFGDVPEAREQIAYLLGRLRQVGSG